MNKKHLYLNTTGIHSMLSSLINTRPMCEWKTFKWLYSLIANPVRFCRWRATTLCEDASRWELTLSAQSPCRQRSPRVAAAAVLEWAARSNFILCPVAAQASRGESGSVTWHWGGENSGKSLQIGSGASDCGFKVVRTQCWLLSCPPCSPSLSLSSQANVFAEACARQLNKYTW